MKAVLSPSPARPARPGPVHPLPVPRPHGPCQQWPRAVAWCCLLLRGAAGARASSASFASRGRAGGRRGEIGGREETAKERRRGERCVSSPEVCSSFRDVDGQSMVGEGGGGSRVGVRVERACGCAGLSGLCLCFVSS